MDSVYNMQQDLQKYGECLQHAVEWEIDDHYQIEMLYIFLTTEEVAIEW